MFARAWARSLHAVYIGLVQRGFVSALHVALQARSDDEKVLRLDPKYIDAKLVVGVHQYVTGSLPFGLKIIAGAAGISGSKPKGIQDLRDAGGQGVITSVEARTALGLFLRREAKYGDAIAVTRTLTDEFRGIFSSGLNWPISPRTLGRAKPPSRSTNSCWSKPRNRAFSLPLTWNLPGMAWPTPCRGKKTMLRPPQPTMKPPLNPPSAWI